MQGSGPGGQVSYCVPRADRHPFFPCFVDLPSFVQTDADLMENRIDQDILLTYPLPTFFTVFTHDIRVMNFMKLFLLHISIK